MPFLSKDWRDPGDQWVRYDGGWEKRKTLSTSEGPNSSSPHHHFATTIPAELRQQAHQHESQTTSGYKPAAKQDLVAVDRDGNFVNRHMQVSIFVLKITLNKKFLSTNVIRIFYQIHILWDKR